MKLRTLPTHQNGESKKAQKESNSLSENLKLALDTYIVPDRKPLKCLCTKHLSTKSSNEDFYFPHTFTDIEQRFKFKKLKKLKSSFLKILCKY